jgi:type I restriction enzyme R subunit
VVRKISNNEQVTAAELEELSALFTESEFGSSEDIEQATADYEGFGLFLRSMTGLNYEAAAVAVDQFRSGRTLTSQQHGYLELLIEVLAKNGSAIIDELYKAPFTLRAPQGPEQLFTDTEIDGIEAVLKAVRAKARPMGPGH